MLGWLKRKLAGELTAELEDALAENRRLTELLTASERERQKVMNERDECRQRLRIKEMAEAAAKKRAKTKKGK